MTVSEKFISIGLIVGLAALSGVANAQEARITVGDLSNPTQLAAFDRALVKATTGLCGNRKEDLGHLAGRRQAEDYKVCAAAVRDEAVEQLSSQARAQYVSATARPAMVASAFR